MEGKKKNSALNSRISVRFKLFLGLIIPIICILVLGVLSYLKASRSLTEDYEEATERSMDAVTDYLSLAFDTVTINTNECMTNGIVTTYVQKTDYKNTDAGYYTAKTDIQTLFRTKVTLNSIIKNIVLIPAEGFDTVATCWMNPDKLDGAFATLKDDKTLNFATLDGVWTKDRHQLDDIYDISEKYLFSFYRRFPSAKAAIFVDVNEETVAQSLNGLDFGEGSTVALILPDGTEFHYGDTIPTEADYFKNLACYNELLGAEALEARAEEERQFKQEHPDEEMPEAKRFTYSTIGTEEYFFTYAKTSGGFTVCALVPRANMIGEVNSLKLITIEIVAIASVISAAIVFYLMRSISLPIREISGKLKRVADGDLTVDFKSAGKDEFAVLMKSLDETMTNMRRLLAKVNETASDIGQKSEKLYDHSCELGELAEGVSHSMGEVSGTVEIVSGNVRESVDGMEVLSGRISETRENVSGIRDFATETDRIIIENIEEMNALVGKSEQASDIMKQLLDEIKKLADNAKVVTSFVDTIADIASQTNLLSLNATIEAAHAGDSGRGFAVVAEEIRKLSDQSTQASDEIRRIATDIMNQTMSTVDNVKQADKIVDEQHCSTTEMIEEFTQLGKTLELLMQKANDINDDMSDMSAARERTLGTVNNINESTSKTLELSQHVEGLIEEHEEATVSLEELSKELKASYAELSEAVNVFRI